MDKVNNNNPAIPRIVGTGYSLPKKRRGNDDPVFDWIKNNIPDCDKLFSGYKIRRVLDESEDLMDIMIPAAKQALKNAGKKAKDVDLLLGVASISQFRNPNMLSLLHRKLKLPERCWVLPQGNAYSNFNAAVYFADALLQAGRVNTILICVGGNWTRNVDYHTTQAVSAGDGAGAAVMTMSTDKTKFNLVDSKTLTQTKYYGSMFTGRTEYMAKPPIPSFLDTKKMFSDHFFHIDKLGEKGFEIFGVKESVYSTIGLLEEHGIPSVDMCFFPNQSSAQLLLPWVEAIHPGQTIQTITKFANLTVATTPVNLAYAESKNMIKKDWIVLQALGPDMHSNSLLLRRG